MKFLINRGININTFRREGETPRHYAVRMGSREKVELLLESGADGTTKDVRGLTPAEVAKEKVWISTKFFLDRTQKGCGDR
jgi:ankyrin repeat protein